MMFCLAAASLLCAATAYSQNDSYYCDFEDQNEHHAWVLNVGKDGENCANKWYIGQPGSNGGVNGLYISGDGGVTTNYSGTPTFVAAYRILTLPAGTYELSFDWQALGAGNGIAVRPIHHIRVAVPALLVVLTAIASME